MRVLAITKVFPNAIVPLDEPHIRQQYAALGAICDVEVLASIPWFPGSSLLSRWSLAGRVAKAPPAEVIEGLEVSHPRFLQVPKLGFPFQAASYAAALLPTVLRRKGDFDAVLATWAYPDGVAAISIGRLLGLPVVVEVIGSDINVVAERRAARWQLRRALPRAHRIVAVSRQLGQKVEALGVPRERIAVIPTGIDPAIFYPREREACRRQLGLPAEGRMLLYVGRVERAKGIFELLEAFAGLLALDGSIRLVIVGGGSALEQVQQRARELGSAVLVAGQRPIDEVPFWLGACDAMTLPSWAEGTPNVILEALACGRKVVASAVGGIPDVVRDESQGALVPPRDAQALALALASVLRSPYQSDAVAAAAGVLTLRDNAERLHDVLQQAIAEKGA